MSVADATRIEAVASLLGPQSDYRPTETSFGRAFIDVDEWRDAPRRHRYVHGGFEDTHTRFSLYFPPRETPPTRFIQPLEGGSGGHDALLTVSNLVISGRKVTGLIELGTGDWMIDLAFDELDGYIIESNQGHFYGEGTGFANPVELWGASAETARFAKHLAARLYGAAPQFGYVFGGSGGGSRSIYCIENAPEVYDGGVPMVIGSGGLMQGWSAVGQWWLHARHKLAEIVDATAPGGSGDPFATLTNEQREALAATYRFGYPRGAESQLWQFSPWLWPLAQAAETPYYRDFWTRPGYLGHDNPAAISHLIVERKATVGRVTKASEVKAGTMVARLATAGAASDHSFAIRLAEDLEDNTALFGAKFTFLTGKAKGRSVYITNVVRSALTTSAEMHPELFAGVEEGDEVQIDNRDFVAWCYLHRYTLDVDEFAVPDVVNGGRMIAPEFGGLRAYALDGKPTYPQQPRGPIGNPASNSHTGRFKGKMIHVNATHDSMVWPAGVAAYERKVRNHLGSAIDGQYRLWWVENAPHGAPEVMGPTFTPERDPLVWRSRLVDYSGVVAQGLRDVRRWVEDGVEPPPSTRYRFLDDGELVLPTTAAERLGVQPVASATANGAVRCDVRVGEPVRLEGVAEQPPGTGAIVYAEWDFEGTGATDFTAPLDGRSPRVTASATHAYEKPGVYFASFRAGGHREGREGRDGRGLAAENLARVRVVVSA